MDKKVTTLTITLRGVDVNEVQRSVAVVAAAPASTVVGARWETGDAFPDWDCT